MTCIDVIRSWTGTIDGVVLILNSKVRAPMSTLIKRKKSISNLKTVQLYFIALSSTFYGIVYKLVKDMITYNYVDLIDIITLISYAIIYSYTPTYVVIIKFKSCFIGMI